MLDNQTQSNGSRGGKRAGAGRKPSTIKGIAKKLPKFSAELLLTEIKANQKLVQLASCGEPAVELQAIKFLWEQAYGRPKQAIQHEGSVEHRHLDLSRMSDEDLYKVRDLIESSVTPS